MSRVAAVVLGRNEGPRLARCLESVRGRFDPVVYVDSDSEDGSPDVARSLGAHVVALPLLIPFPFGHGRNAGAARAREIAPCVEYIQFVDADSEIVPGWCDAALAALAEDRRLAVVCGRLGERHPGESLYDRLYEIEFDPRTEAADVFGGMSMIRTAAYAEVGGFQSTMFTFEDHELGFRLRRAGWHLRALDTEMAIHEGGMTRFAQWWQRERRAGHGRAHLVALHGGANPAWVRACASIVAWGIVLPAASLLGAPATAGTSLLLLVAHPLLALRIYRRMRRAGLDARAAALFAAARVVGKFPQAHGLLSFCIDAARGAARRAA